MAVAVTKPSAPVPAPAPPPVGPLVTLPNLVTRRGLFLGLALVIGFTIAGCFSVFHRYEVIGTG